LTLLAGFLLVLVPVSFGASVVNNLFFRRGTHERFLGGDPGAYAVRNVVLTPRALNDIGLTNWVIDVPGAWKVVHRSPEAVQWATPSGVVLTIFRVNALEDDAAAVLRQASGSASWTEVSGTRSVGADRAAADFVPKPGADELKGASRRLEVRRANAPAWIGVASDRRGDLDDAAWRQFLARVLESIRKA
jgi:hypothetical protein